MTSAWSCSTRCGRHVRMQTHTCSRRVSCILVCVPRLATQLILIQPGMLLVTLLEFSIVQCNVAAFQQNHKQHFWEYYEQEGSQPGPNTGVYSVLSVVFCCVIHSAFLTPTRCLLVDMKRTSEVCRDSSQAHGCMGGLLHCYCTDSCTLKLLLLSWCACS